MIQTNSKCRLGSVYNWYYAIEYEPAFHPVEINGILYSRDGEPLGPALKDDRQ